MDKKKALYRAKLKAQKQDKRIDSPLVRYNESEQPVCKVCDIPLKSESAWTAHQISAKHRQAIEHLKAKTVKPSQPKPEPQSGLPSDFFDKPAKNNEISNAKLIDSNKKKKTVEDKDVEITNAKLMDNNNKKKTVEDKDVEITSGTIAETQTSETRTLPVGFFDDKDADLRARGITPVKLDIKDEYKEFEKLIQEDLKEVDNRMEEEEYDAAEMIEEAETVEQMSFKERVEIFKRKKLELKAARTGKRGKVSQVVDEESSLDESSSDDDAVDWRAKHL